MTLAKKLQLRPGTRIKLAGVPSDMRGLIAPLPEGTKLLTRGKAPFDGAIVFCRRERDVVEKATPLLNQTTQDGLLWLCYPKGTSGLKTDISRDKGWESIAAQGLRPVRAVSIDDTWSALRWRPKLAVNSKS